MKFIIVNDFFIQQKSIQIINDYRCQSLNNMSFSWLIQSNQYFNYNKI